MSQCISAQAAVEIKNFVQTIAFNKNPLKRKANTQGDNPYAVLETDAINSLQWQLIRVHADETVSSEPPPL